MTARQIEAIETASTLRRGLRVWYAAFGGIGAWTVHLVALASAEHWTHVHPRWSWTLHAVTVLCAVATGLALLLAWRLLLAVRGIAAGAADGADDASQLRFLAQIGLLVGSINLALILLEGSYVLFIPRA